MKLKPLIAAFCIIASCAGIAPLDLKQKAVTSLPDYAPETVQANPFQIFTLTKLTSPSAPIRIYIEGDGKAFLNANTISPNPTPVNQTLLELVRLDPAPNIIYIARPCQFTEDAACDEKYWTTSRFAPETISAINEVIQKYRTRPIELIGYSGGAEIAVFLAAQNPNVISLRSIAGNLDFDTFTTIHHSIPLTGSANPDAAIRAISHLPQIHFVGEDDKIVPPAIANAYKAKQQDQSCSQYHIVAHATHNENWQAAWPSLLQLEPHC